MRANFGRAAPNRSDLANAQGDFMAWFILFVAGLLETGWAIGLKYTDGFTKLVPSVLTGGAMVASMYLLAVAVRTLPIGTAYAVWVGIGAAGTAILGIVLLEEPVTLGRVVFLALLVAAIIGLKATAPE
jgi:quaternary ammonium compound-resistance protein SugE